MKIAITLDSKNQEQNISEVFGRCLYFGIYDSESQKIEYKENSAKDYPSGAGRAAAQTMIDLEVKKIITGDVGPKAFQILDQAGIQVQKESGKTLNQVIDEIKV